MKILTANIVLGLHNMNRLGTNVRGLAAFHSWPSFLIAILCPPLRGRWGGPPYSAERLAYLQKHGGLEPTLRLISDTDPDILVLNEVVLEIHKTQLDDSLVKMGFVSITYGIGDKYPDAHVSTVVAAKEKAEIIVATMPQTPHPGCGGGIAGLRLENGISVIGAHMALGGTNLWHKQLEALTTIIGTEKGAGQKVIFAGDCNESEKRLTPSFAKLDLISADTRCTRTCPTSLPRIFQRSIDHIYVPHMWRVQDLRTVAFGSDHLALFVTI